MNIHGMGRYRWATRMIVSVIAFGFIGLGCRHVVSPAQSKSGEVPRRPQATSVDNYSELIWAEQMKNAAAALHQKAYALAEHHCVEALKTAGNFGPADARRTTNLVYLAGIYQTENKSELAEQTFKEAITSREQALGTNDPSLVMPLDTLANFYYFAERRYDLATPLCLRILQLVENASPRDDAEVEQRARAVAAVYRIQGQYAQAEPFYRQTLDLAVKNGGDLPGCLLVVSGFYHDWGKYDEAEALCQRALAIQEKAAASDTNAEAQMNLAISLYGLAENYRAWGKLDQADPLYRRSVAMVEQALGQNSSDLARPLAGLAATLAAQGETNQAAVLYQRAFAVTEDQLEPGDPVVKAVLDDYTALLDGLNRTEEANSLRQSYQWRVLIYNSTRALRANELEAAKRFAGEALDLAGTFGPTDTRLSRSQVQMAEVYRQQGTNDLAEQMFEAAVASCEKAAGTNQPDLIAPLESLANFYYYTKVQYDQVASLYQRILNIVRAAPAPNPLEVARWERNLAEVYHLQGRNIQAEAGYQQALAAVEMATNAPEGDQVQYLLALADFYRTGAKYDEAEDMARRALTIREKALGPGAGPDAELDVAVCCDSLAQIYLAGNKPDQAESFYNRSLPIVEKVAGADSAELTPRLMGLATAMRAQKKYAEAEAQYRRALTIMEQNVGPEASPVADVLDQYAALLEEMNKPGDAKSMREWADSVRQQDALRMNN
ncbi:MAG: tetratricopeptide repeat protein [Verrucomicrobiia bacterium]